MRIFTFNFSTKKQLIDIQYKYEIHINIEYFLINYLTSHFIILTYLLRISYNRYVKIDK